METLMSEALLMSQPQTCTVTPNVISLQASEANHPPQHPDDMKLQLTKKWFESRLAQEDGMEIGAGVSAIHLYAVTAYRYGMRDDHSYVVGIYSTLDLAKSAADQSDGSIEASEAAFRCRMSARSVGDFMEPQAVRDH